jgi:opacity protein-like surface antigen
MVESGIAASESLKPATVETTRRVVVWIASVLAATVLHSSQAAAEAKVEANRLFVKAASFVRLADTLRNDPSQAIGLYKLALGLLDQIESKYPGTDMAVKIVSYQKIGTIGRNVIEGKLSHLLKLTGYSLGDPITVHQPPASVSAQSEAAQEQPQLTKAPQTPVPSPPEKQTTQYLPAVFVPPVDRTWYGRLGIGYSNPESIGGRAGTTLGTSVGDAELSDSAAYEVAFGRYLGSSFKLELEAGARNFDIDEVVGIKNQVKNIASSDVAGNVDLFTGMFNGYYDLPVSWRLKPYLGGGLGMAYVKANNVLTARSRPFNNHAWVPVGAAMVGLDFPINEKIGFDLGYKYLILGDLTGSRDDKAGRSDIVKIHNVTGSLRYYFGN